MELYAFSIVKELREKINKTMTRYVNAAFIEFNVDKMNLLKDGTDIVRY